MKRYYSFFISLALILSILVVYWNVTNNEFISYDDSTYVTDNPYVKKGLTAEGFIWAFTSTRASNWHPVTWLSHMLDSEIYGIDSKGHHFTNLLFHIASTLLLFLVLKRMTGRLWRSAFVSALFAFHPLHVESVAWVAERKDVLSAFFWMLTIWAYVRYTERPLLKRYFLVFLALLIGLMAKPMLVTLPFVLLLMDIWPLGRLDVRQKGLKSKIQSEGCTKNYQSASAYGLVVEKIPLLVLVVLSSLITFFVQQRGGAVGSFEKYTLITRIANALISYVRYIEKMIWPHDLAVFYPHPGNTFSLWQVTGAFVLLTGVSFFIIKAARRNKYIVAGWLWYVLTLVPVIGLVQVGAQSQADRYTYIPLIGLFIIIAWGVLILCQNGNIAKYFLHYLRG